MRTNRTIEPDSLPITRSGVIVAEGYGLRLYVRRGVLHVEDGEGPNGRRVLLTRATSRGIRIVLLGRAGSISVEALRWIADAGVGFGLIDASSGRAVVTSSAPGTNDPALRRLQALAPYEPFGLRIAKDLMARKIAGQLAVLRDRFPRATTEAAEVETSLGKIGDVESLRELQHVEADAAISYWRAWQELAVSFVRTDELRVPPHWGVFPGRKSPLGTSPRRAGCPANALLNLGYGLGELEARLACLAMGLDPGLGIVHTDQRARDSLALDVLETIRPAIDRWVIDLTRAQPFRKSDFHETSQGVFRVGPELAKTMAESLVMWRELLSPVVEGVVRGMRASDRQSAPVALTDASRSYRSERAARTAGRIRACRVCGVLLETGRRSVCDECLPAYEAERTHKLSGAGKATLASMRASADDPAKTEEAHAKQAARSREVMLANRAWERQNGRVFNVERYESEMLPRIRAMSVSALVHSTGLSQYYLWRVKKGERRLHPRHWDIVLDASHVAT